MVPDSFHDYFVASAGVSGALIGLLFVAVAVSPDRIVRLGAPTLAREAAIGAFAMLSNALFISLAALIPGFAVPYAILISSSAGIATTLLYATDSWLDRRQNGIGFAWYRRRVLTLCILVWEFVIGVTLWRHPEDSGQVVNVTVIVIILFAVGLSRAWELLGGAGHGVSDAMQMWRYRHPGKRDSG